MTDTTANAPQDLPPAIAQVMTPSRTDVYIETFRALGEPVRLEIVRLIRTYRSDDANDTFPCTELEQRLPVSKSTISYHVKILSSIGLVNVTRDGRNFRYRLNDEVFEFLLPGFLNRLAAEPPIVESAPT